MIYIESNLKETWIRITLILILSVYPTLLLGKNKASTTYLNKQLNDSSIVYYSYDSGEIIITFIPNSDQDTTAIRKPDIIIIGEILDSKDFSQTAIDTLDDHWFKQTNYQSYTYTVKVKDVIYGLCTKNYLEITVTSSLSNEFKSRFSHISENGDSIDEVIIKANICCGHSINKQIPVGEDCIFHFRQGDLKIVDYISSYSYDDLNKYMIKSSLETEH